MADGVTSGDGLLAVIADEETVTGFLLAGVGDIAPNKKKNFMTVTSSTLFWGRGGWGGVFGVCERWRGERKKMRGARDESL